LPIISGLPATIGKSFRKYSVGRRVDVTGIHPTSPRACGESGRNQGVPLLGRCPVAP
jgi:hypothetical protein